MSRLVVWVAEVLAGSGLVFGPEERDAVGVAGCGIDGLW